MTVSKSFRKNIFHNCLIIILIGINIALVNYIVINITLVASAINENGKIIIKETFFSQYF